MLTAKPSQLLASTVSRRVASTICASRSLSTAVSSRHTATSSRFSSGPFLTNNVSSKLPRQALDCRRDLSLHEYQSKNMLEKFGLNVQPGKEADTPEQAFKVAKELKDQGSPKVVIKCQVLAGGRGKGTLSSGLRGGVQICDTPEEIREFARQMLGYKLKTHQTTGDGELVKKVLIVTGADIGKELYLALMMDRTALGPVAVASTMGGVDIEEVAEKNPSAIKTHPIDITKGMTDKDAVAIAETLGFSSNDKVMSPAVAEQLRRLYKLFIETDATQVEINPLAIVNNARSAPESVVFIDAKLSFDDFAGYRQKALFAMEDLDTRDSRELAAETAGMNFVALDGTVGCLVNGAGLAMATMDIIKLHGGHPANFLDVGGGADEGQVAEAFKILKGDKTVKVIFVNIFGGIMKCDTIANALIAAVKTVDLKLPLVIRLVGNRVELAKDIIKKAAYKNMHVVDDFRDAAQMAVTLGR